MRAGRRWRVFGGRCRGRGGGKGKGGRKGDFIRPVNEGRVIELQAQMLEFRDSDQDELPFPPGLDNHERRAAPQHCTTAAPWRSP